MVLCSAKSVRSGQQCQRHAMHNKTVCWIHGGSASTRPGTNLRAGGRYSKALERAPVVQAYYHAARDDPKIEETLNEIALLRGKLMHWLETHAESVEPTDLEILRGYASDISRVVERRHHMLYGDKVAVTVRDFDVFAGKLLAMVEDEYGRDERLARVQRAASTLFGAVDPAAVGRTTGTADNDS